MKRGLFETKCLLCKKIYQVQFARLKKTKYCSAHCRNVFAGRMGGIKSRGVSRNKGNKRPDIAKRNRTEWMKKLISGSASGTWKGDKVGYSGLHMWLTRNYGNPGTCEKCNKAGLIGHKIHWANKTGFYKRIKSDWFRLCASCHKKFDNENKTKFKAFKNKKSQYS